MRMRYFLLLLAMLLLPGLALADAVKLGGFWIEDVTVQRVADGQLVYSTATGRQMGKPLAEVQELRLSAFPEIEGAQAALSGGQAQEGVRLLRAAVGRAKQDWQMLYLQRLLIEALATSGGADAAEAARRYAELVRTNPDPFFVPPPPVEAVQGLTEPEKGALRETLTQLRARAPERYGAAVDSLLVAASASPPASAPLPGSAGTPGAAGAPPAKPAVLLPVWADAADPVVVLLRREEFKEAVEMADRVMTNPETPLARPLYYKGIAQVALADGSGDKELYKDAGLNFMRIITFFDPKASTVPAAMIEVAYIHQRIGRPDVARRMLENAQALLDEESDPAYYQRLTTLLAASR